MFRLGGQKKRRREWEKKGEQGEEGGRERGRGRRVSSELGLQYSKKELCWEKVDQIGR